MCPGWLSAWLDGRGVSAVKAGIADGFFPERRLPYEQHWSNQIQGANALAHLGPALAWMPDNPWYLSSLAKQNTLLGWEVLRRSEEERERQDAQVMIEEALRLYNRALYQSPADPHIHLGQMFTQQVLWSFDKEDNALKQALIPWSERVSQLAPAYPDIQYGLGYLLIYVRPAILEEDIAQPFFQKAIALNERYIALVWQAYQQALPEAEALAYFAQVVPRTAEGYLQAAKAVEASYWSQSRLFYRTALTLDRGNANGLYAYANALERHQDF